MQEAASNYNGRAMSQLPGESDQQQIQVVEPPKLRDPLEPGWEGQKWEYAQVTGPPDPAQMAPCLAQWGQFGWELCGQLVLQQQMAGMAPNRMIQKQMVAVVVLTFKRPCSVFGETPQT